MNDDQTDQSDGQPFSLLDELPDSRSGLHGGDLLVAFARHLREHPGKWGAWPKPPPSAAGRTPGDIRKGLGQRREHAVPCGVCYPLTRIVTWNASAICSRCAERQVRAAVESAPRLVWGPTFDEATFHESAARPELDGIQGGGLVRRCVLPRVLCDTPRGVQRIRADDLIVVPA